MGVYQKMECIKKMKIDDNTVKSESQNKILHKYHRSQDWVISFNANTVI